MCTRQPVDHVLRAFLAFDTLGMTQAAMSSVASRTASVAVSRLLDATGPTIYPAKPLIACSSCVIMVASYVYV
jgi:hypothetical protein